MNIIRFCTGLTLLFISLSASAQQWYHVELVVFERFSGANEEQWLEMNEIRQGSLQPGMATTHIQPAKNESLIGVARRLQSASDYRVLYHQAWQQPILSMNSAKAVQIHSDDGLIEGVLRFYKLTYLNADIDLWLKEQNAPINSWGDNSDENFSSAVRNPHLQEIRRVHSNKLIYFDHPRVAAILKLTPVATPAEAVSKTPESYSLPVTDTVSESPSQQQ